MVSLPGADRLRVGMRWRRGCLVEVAAGSGHSLGQVASNHFRREARVLGRARDIPGGDGVEEGGGCGLAQGCVDELYKPGIGLGHDRECRRGWSRWGRGGGPSRGRDVGWVCAFKSHDP